MPRLHERHLAFEFAADWDVQKFDAWAFVRGPVQQDANRFVLGCHECGAAMTCQTCGERTMLGFKAVDFAALDPGRVLWLIEVKDYRRFRRTKPSDLASEISRKVRDTLAALMAAATNAHSDELKFARQACRATALRIVVHLEQPAKHSKLFPRSIDPARLAQDLKQLVKSIDPHPQVQWIGSSPSIPWHVSSEPPLDVVS